MVKIVHVHRGTGSTRNPDRGGRNAECAARDHRDVAAASGVGVGTVSRVINGAANVREVTRARVLKVIDQLGYRPSHLATALSRGTQRSVAIVVPHLTRPSVVERLAGALAVLDAEATTRSSATSTRRPSAITSWRR